MISDFTDQYLKMREEIDTKCNKLWKQHHKNMLCSEGCASCCQNFSILPVEFFVLEDLLKNQSVRINSALAEGECKFLINNRCSIYEHRPVICRTHGYPLVRVNDMDDTYEVSFCHLNFKDVKLDSFKQRNVFFEEKYNIKLFKLNQKFLSKWPAISKEKFGLIELSKLKINID